MRHILLITFLLVSKIGAATPILSWEEKNSKNSEWTAITLNAIEKNFDALDKAEDITDFCPEYRNLEKDQKIHAWGELISAITFYESSWNRYAYMEEVSLGIDPITALPYVSSGLMQLSYGNKRWAKWCEFHWETDRTAQPKDISIFKPKNNLECGIGILANQIQRRDRIVLSDGAYWAVIKKNNRHRKITNIEAMVQKLPFCIAPIPRS